MASPMRLLVQLLVTALMACALLARGATAAPAPPEKTAPCTERGKYCGTGPTQAYPCCGLLRCGATSGPNAVCK